MLTISSPDINKVAMSLYDITYIHTYMTTDSAESVMTEYVHMYVSLSPIKLEESKGFIAMETTVSLKDMVLIFVPVSAFQIQS